MARSYHMRKVIVYKKLADNSWDTTGVEITDANKIEVKQGTGKIKDTFRFTVNNANDKLTRRYYTGDGLTVAFTLPAEYQAPSSFYDTDKFKVYVNETLQTYTTDYSISGTTLTFVSAPSASSQNIRVEYEVISADDKCAIWLWQDKLWASMSQAEKDIAFAIEGVITEPTLASNDTGRKLTVNGTGIIEVIFNALAFVKPDYSSATKKWYELIQSMIAQINQYAPAEKKIYGQDATEWANLGNPVTDSEGNAFPDIQFSASYKRAIEIIEELTQDKYTNDGQYIYYVKRYSNGNYGLYVRYKDPDITSGNSITQGVQPIETKAKRSTDNVINAVIYNCGFDPYEAGMEYLNYNPASQSSMGSKWKYVTSTSHLGATLLNIEFEADTSKWETTSDGGRKENFPKDASYDYTFTFYERDNAGVPGVSLAEASDDDEFRDIIRVEAKWRGKEETDRIIKLYSNPRYETTHLIYQSNSYALGEAYNIILPSFGLHNEHPLRLKEIKHTFWTTELEYEEDETVASLA